jgi:peptidyl-prolyl cis-trans isomerase D
MMQAIRGRAGSIIVKILFGLLIISFGYWGIYVRSPFSSGSNSPDTTVATVGDRSISAEELQRALQPTIERLRTQFGSTPDAQQLNQLGVTSSVLDQLIDVSLVDQEAQRLGLEIPDSVVRNAIYENPNFRGPDGRFDRELFEQALMLNRLTEDQLVARLRREIPRATLIQALVAGVRVPPHLVDVLYKYRNEERLADIVAFPAASIGNIAQPSAADLQKFYDAHKSQFRSPEFRSFTLASLSPGDITDTAPIPEDKLRKAWEQRKDEFGNPEQREIQQILAPSEAKAKEAEAALKAGKDWNDVATKIAGQDPDTLDLGLLSQKQMPSELAGVAFKLVLNTPSQPIKSPLGWHILRVTKIVPATLLTFEQAKPKLEDALKTDDAVNRLANIGNQADDALAGGATLADDAKKFGLKLMTIAAVDDAGNGPDGKPVKLPVAAAEVLKTVFTSNSGDTSRVTDTKDGAIFAVQVDKSMPPAIRPLSAVKDKVAADWLARQKQQAAAKEAKTLAAAASPGTPLATAAAARGFVLLPSQPLTRTPLPGQTIPPQLVAELFSAKPGEVVTFNDSTGAYAAQLKEIQIPKTVPPSAAQTITTQLDEETRADVADEYTNGLRKRFPIDIKQSVLDRMF